MAAKLKKPSKKERRDRIDINGVIGILPLLSDVFNVEPPEVTTEDLLACEPDKVFDVYNYFLRCISLISADDLSAPPTLKSSLKTDIFSKDLAYPSYRMRFFLAVREMLALTNGPKFCWKDLAAPDLTRTIIFFKNLIYFLRFYSDECLKYLSEKQEETSLRCEVTLLRKEVSESLERHEMHLAKADMEENAKCKVQEEIAAISSEIESISKKMQIVGGDIQEGEKSNLHSRERINEATLCLLEAQRITEQQSKLLVTSPDKLVEQKRASERILECLYVEQQALEAQVNNSKKMEAYDHVLTEFENIIMNCREFEPLVRDTDIAKQNSVSLVRRKEELQKEIESLLQKRSLLAKRMDNLRIRYDRLTSSANQQTVSKLPNEAEFLHSELESNIENIDDIKLDISSLNEVMDEYRKSFQEQKSKLIAYIETFTEGYNTSREELNNKVTTLEEYFMRNRNKL